MNAEFDAPPGALFKIETVVVSGIAPEIAVVPVLQFVPVPYSNCNVGDVVPLTLN